MKASLCVMSENILFKMHGASAALVFAMNAFLPSEHAQQNWHTETVIATIEMKKAI